MEKFILIFAWSWIAIGLTSGTIIGLKFANPDWLGGYGSWQRRMIRLGHIAFLGTALLNIAMVLTAIQIELSPVPKVAAILLLIGAISMPTVCFLSAWHKPLRHLFFIPVIGLLGGAIDFVVQLLSAM